MENPITSFQNILFSYQIKNNEFEKIGSVAIEVKKVLKNYFSKNDYTRRLGVCVFEAEANLAIHTNHGGTIEVLILEDRVRITAKDDGPGIKDIEKALTAGFSTASESARLLGFGGGVGLNNIKRISDFFDLQSNENGTTLVCEIWDHENTDSN